MSERKQPESRAVLPIISAITFLGFLDTNLLIPIMALYATELGAGVGITGIIIGLYSITNTIANVLFGRLIDRIGYKIPLIAGLLGDTLSMFLYSLCRLPVHLGLVRALHGTSGGMVGPATMSVFADYSGERKKGRVMGIYGMSLGLSTLVGFGLSGVFVSRLGYRALFLFGAAMLAIGTILSLSLPGTRKTSDMATRSKSGEGFAKVKGLLKRRGLIIAYCAIFAQYFAFGGVVTLLPLYVKGLGMGAFHVGMLLAIFAIMFSIAQIPSGALSDKVGRLMPIAIGLSLGTVSLLILPSLRTFPLLAAVMALYGVAFGILFPSISASIADHTVSEERGLATGMFHALLTAGVAIGAPVIGWAGEAIGIKSGLMSTSGIMILALVIVLITSKRAPVY